MKHKKSFSRLQKFLLFSFLFHIFITSTIVLTPYLRKTRPEQIEVTLIEPSPSVVEAVDNKKAKEVKQPSQVVQMDENQSNNEIDSKAKYLSAKNNTVKKETVAKNIGQFKNSTSQKNAAPQPAQKEIEKQTAEQKTELKSKLFNTGFDAYASLSKNDSIRKMALKEHSFQNGTSSKEASSTNDHLENTEPSLMTQLNTREYKYYGYHKRIRTQLDQWYETKLRDQMKKIMSQGRTIASEENKRTQLLIILNPQGNLVRIQVMGASGVRELDDAAVEAFKKAAPFPNPPKGMVDADGTIKVRWDFVLS